MSFPVTVFHGLTLSFLIVVEMTLEINLYELWLLFPYCILLTNWKNEKLFKILMWKHVLFSMAQQHLVCHDGVLIFIEASQSTLDTPYVVGLFWMSDDQPDAEASTWQTHNTHNLHNRHSPPQQDSNLQF